MVLVKHVLYQDIFIMNFPKNPSQAKVVNSLDKVMKRDKEEIELNIWNSVGQILLICEIFF